MYTFFGGYLIAIIGLGFIALGIFAGKEVMKRKLSKQEDSNQ